MDKSCVLFESSPRARSLETAEADIERLIAFVEIRRGQLRVAGLGTTAADELLQKMRRELTMLRHSLNSRRPTYRSLGT
jgi:hypothetical protein